MAYCLPLKSFRKGGVALLLIVGMAIAEFIAVMVASQGVFQNIHWLNREQTLFRLNVAAEGGLADALLQYSRDSTLSGNLSDLTINGIAAKRSINHNGAMAIISSAAAFGDQAVELSRQCDIITGRCLTQ